jgi:hypothetical protein
MVEDGIFLFGTKRQNLLILELKKNTVRLD